MRIRSVLLGLAAVFALGCDVSGVGEQVIELPEPGANDSVVTSTALQADRSARAPRRYIVLLEDGAGLADVDSEIKGLSQKHGAVVHGTWRHAVRGFVAEMAQSEAVLLAKSPRVALVEEDGIVTVDTVQTNATWGLDRIDQQSLPLSGSYTYFGDGSGVHVYIIDTGIRATHVDFGGRASGAFSVIDGGTDDCNGHGTHVAATVGGSAFGVAKKVTLHAVRVFGCGSMGFTSDMISGVDWVTAHHLAPAVANMSLGGGASVALDTAVQNAIKAGVTVVVAAGNSAADACLTSPARVGAAITVGASGSADRTAGFSNYGPCLDLYGPGVFITSASNASDTASGYKSGTSMAAPHVSGVAALYLQAHPTAGAAEVAWQIAKNASSGLLSGLVASSPNLLLYNQFNSEPFIPQPPTRCSVDANCSSSMYCAAGPFVCQWTALAAHAFPMSRALPFRGNDGAWTRIYEASTVIGMQTGRTVSFRFPYSINSPVPSYMGADVRLLVDGAQVAYTPAQGAGGARTFDVTANVAAGFHSVDIEMRSRLLNGPPANLQVWSGGYNDSSPTTLSAMVVRK